MSLGVALGGGVGVVLGVRAGDSIRVGADVRVGVGVRVSEGVLVGVNVFSVSDAVLAGTNEPAVRVAVPAAPVGSSVTAAPVTADAAEGGAPSVLIKVAFAADPGPLDVDNAVPPGVAASA